MKLPHFHRAEIVVLLVLTVAIWGYCQSLGAVEEAMIADRYGAVPVRMWAAWHSLLENGPSRDVLLAAVPLVTANFLHASLGHVAMNMLFFWIFGNIVSEAIGRVGVVVLYLLAGIVAVLVYVKTNPTSEIPMVGASGAIAGLEGAYFVFAFRWELPSPHVWPLEGPIPPWRFGVVALVNFFLDTQAFFGHAGGSTAYGAHVGGFVGGALIAMVVASFWRPKWRRRD
jgi:membrane associated rhomboid family serine protease